MTRELREREAAAYGVVEGLIRGASAAHAGEAMYDRMRVDQSLKGIFRNTDRSRKDSARPCTTCEGNTHLLCVGDSAGISCTKRKAQLLITPTPVPSICSVCTRDFT